MTTCTRCGRPTHATTMSMFDTRLICLTCKAEERQHPRYAEALAADLAAITQGDFNFPGIGWPA